MKVWSVRDPEISLHSDLVVVRADVLRELTDGSVELSAMEAAGVDSWSGRDAIDWERVERRKERLGGQIDAALNWGAPNE
jgi:hypothetical protein